MAANFELWSFVNKFHQLLDCGLSAEMQISSTAGKLSTNLNAEVESPSLIQQSNYCTNKSKPSPSKLRRRQRREAARIRNSNARANANESFVVPNQEVSTCTENSTLEDSEDVLTPLATTDISTDIANQSQVDTAVQAVYKTRDVACGNESLHTCDFSSQFSAADEVCTFCEVEFLRWNEFSNHVRRFSFMCANCLDFFNEKPWFSRSDLICIDTDEGVQLHHVDTIIDLTPR